MKTVFTQDWKDWITTNVNAGQDKDGIFKILLDEGYTFAAIAKQMNYQPSRPVEELVNPFHANAAQQQRTAASSNTSTGNHYKTAVQQQNLSGNNGLAITKQDIFIPNAVSLKSDLIDLRLVDDFLSAEECTKLIERIKIKLRPSSVANFQVDNHVRTSRTCDLGQMDDPFIQDIDLRICKLLGIHSAYTEVLQGQYYEIGQEFKAHTDFFEPQEFKQHCSEYGQRTYTVMIYLNDVEQGGETCFRNINTEFKPMTGQALIWNSLNPDGTTNMNTLHQAKPVEKGFKSVITKWFRTTSPQAQSIPMMPRQINEYLPNYTRSGITKTKLSDRYFKMINDFYHDNHQEIREEHVEGGFIVSGNKRSSKSSSKKRESSSVIELTAELRQKIHDALKPMMEEWSGVALQPTFVYGIREYHNGAVLKMHRDRIDTHIISAIINVAQETDVEWPLVIEDNYFRIHHIFLKPGEMVFYEGGRLLHGRPLAFDGKSFANMFCHFKPSNYVAPKIAELQKL